MSDYVKDYLNENMLNNLSKEISYKIEKFQEYNNPEIEKEKIGLLDYNFSLSGGSVVESDNESNTYFSFDFDDDSSGKEFMKEMYKVDPEENEEIKKLESAFIQLLSERLVEDYKSVFQKTIRKAILQEASEEAVPLKEMKILSLEIVDYSSTYNEDKYLYKFIKPDDCNINMQNVQSRILEVREDNPNKPLKEIVEEEKRNNNIDFLNIVDVEKSQKYLWDLNLSMYVDYSFSEKFLAESERLKTE